MNKYSESSKSGVNFIISFLKKRMKEKKITQKQISLELNLNENTVSRYFSQETEIPLRTYLEILGILEIRPYLIPAELDKNEMTRIFHN